METWLVTQMQIRRVMWMNVIPLQETRFHWLEEQWAGWARHRLTFRCQQQRRTVCSWNFHLFGKHHSKTSNLKGWRIFKMTAVTLGQNSFQGLVFKAFKNRERSGCVDRLQVRSIDRNLFFFKIKLLIFRWRWQLWMKPTTIKQRYWDGFSFRSVSLVWFTAALDE